MPQAKEPLIRTLVKEALKEAEISAGTDNTKFSIKVLVSNPQSETKLGIRIQLKPLDGSFLFTEPDKKGQLEVALMKKMNNSLEQFDIQVSTDTDVSDPEAIGFFIPLSQIKNMIVKSLKGGEDAPVDISKPSSSSEPKPKPKPIPKDIPPPPPMDDKEDEELVEEEDPMDKWKTGINLKRSGYEGEEGSEGDTTEDLFKKVNTLNELINDVFKKIMDSDYKFKEYYLRNEEHINRTAAIISLIKDDLEDRVEQTEPVGPDQGIEELKNVIKKIIKEQPQPLNEAMRLRTLNEISGIVLKEDYYGFINAGNNMLRSLEGRFEMRESKKYLEYLVKNNIM